MKKLILLVLICCAQRNYAQLSVNVLLPPNGVMEKQQLWNIFVINAGMAVSDFQIKILITEKSSGEPIVSANTGFISLFPGTKQFSASSIGPVQYNILSSNYYIEPGPTGLLPSGMFNACYTFFYNSGKEVIQDCQSFEVASLSPLQLIVPSDGSILDNLYPAFSWIPLSGINNTNRLTYSISFVEVNSNQNASEAIAKNIPFFSARNLIVPSLAYAQNAPSLTVNKQYAWQVTAMNNLTEIAKSEVWSFNTSSSQEHPTPKPEAAYAKLKKEGMDGGSYYFAGSLRFEYLNETSDTTWKIQLYDISTPNSKVIKVAAFDTLKLERGENLISIPGKKIGGLKHKHLYLLQVINSRQERWQLKFEYRSENE